MAYDAPQSRNEAILQNILGANNVLGEPQSRIEAILQSILNDTSYTAEAMSRMEELLLAIKNNGTWDHEPISRNEEILYAKLNGETYDKEPQSRIEALLIDWCNQSPITVVTDISPYLFRQSGGDNNAFVGTEETDSLVGASAVVNQLVNPNGTEEKTVSGSIVSITDAVSAPAKNLVAQIVATQSGTGDPSPSNVRPISGFSAVGLSVNGVVTSIQLGDTVYVGSLNVTTGVLTVDKELVTLDGDENWRINGSNGYFYPLGHRHINAGYQTPMMNYMKGLTNGSSSGLGVWQGRINDQQTNFLVKPDLTQIATVTDWQEYLAENNLTVILRLAEPFEVQLTPTEVSLVLGNNTVFANTGDVTMTYDAHISSVPTVSGHKYLTRINNVVTIQQGTGTAISINDADEDNAHDLTAMFGTAIADYIYSLEQATAGSGIAYLRKYGFFTKDYYPYTTNTLQSVNTSKHTMVGKNQFNVLDYEGFVSTSVTNTRTETGYITTNSANSNRTVNLDLGVLPYGNYYMSFVAKKGNNTDLSIFLIKNGTNRGSSTTGFTFSSNGSDAFILRTFVLANDTNTVSNMQLQFGSTTATAYEPYIKHEYTLPNIDLRGLYKLDASNNLYADGDILESDGTLTRKYEQRPYQSGDESLADAITDGTKTVVKLATPTTETATGFTNPQLVDKDGTEEYTDERDFPLPVGHETDYPLR